MKSRPARLPHLLCVLALLLPLPLAAQRKQPRKIFEVTVKRMDGRKLRGVPVAFGDSAVCILRKKPIAPVAYVLIGIFGVPGTAGTAIGRYRGRPDTVTIRADNIGKISAGRRSLKWVVVPVTTLALATAGGAIGLQVGNERPGILSGLIGLVLGVAVGETVGIPLGVALANGARQRFVLNGGLEAYQKARPALEKYLPR